MAGDPENERLEEESLEGGPIKSFLEHLEDFRWLLIKSCAALALGMLVCLCGANYVMTVIKWPLTRVTFSDPQASPATAWRKVLYFSHVITHPTITYPGTNQVLGVSFGTNHLANFQITPSQQAALNLGSNRFVAVEVVPMTLGTNQVLGWHVTEDPRAVEEMHRLHLDLINLTPAGGFYVAFQIAFYGGMVLAAPFILYNIASFVFPALRMNERKHIYRALFVGGGLFLVGVSFCYFILMPVALAASQMYSQWLGLEAFEWRAEEYISFVCKFILGMGLGFELPVVILTLVKIGVLSYATLRGMWRYMIVIVLILGAVLTTPEVVTQILMAVPLYLLYEITVWIAWFWERKERKRALQAADKGYF
jgi:sec-independent protein translocase protein TatC